MGAAIVENSMRLLKTHKMTMVQQFHFWACTQKGMKSGSRREIGTPKFIAVSFTIVKRWKHPVPTGG